ncbi:hypothetical protein VP01_5599g1 [Puccinia sorghi]|uniref:Uncharacterized protein n=1 Tax=Puccinia sorghi TaxID=27349 RepID=A0A0L6UJ24_9BASI|nr:hypothetical protein VP01_5599g1 [Puccinia sorghi]
MFAHPKPTALLLTRRTICLRSILLSPRIPSARPATRFLSTRSDPPICKFINAASFIGKPVRFHTIIPRITTKSHKIWPMGRGTKEGMVGKSFGLVPSRGLSEI